MMPLEIKNTYLLGLLDEYVEKVVKNPLLNEVQREGRAKDREKFTSEEYLKKVMMLGSSHDGYPESAFGWHLGHQQLLMKTRTKESMSKETQYLSVVKEIVQKIGSTCCAQSNSLATVYPPGGYISWHNNANAAAYNVLLTWSETGDGYWQHVDPITKEIVRINDEKGWNCKVGYFGTYDEPDRVVYHMASTECWRSTVAFVFNTTDTGYMMREECIEEITTDL